MKKIELQSILERKFLPIQADYNEIQSRKRIIDDFINKINGSDDIYALKDIENTDLLALAILSNYPDMDVNDINLTVKKLESDLDNITPSQIDEVKRKLQKNSNLNASDKPIYHIFSVLEKKLGFRIALESYISYLFLVSSKYSIKDILRDISIAKKTIESRFGINSKEIDKSLKSGYREQLVNLRRFIDKVTDILGQYNKNIASKEKIVNSYQSLIKILKDNNDLSLLDYNNDIFSNIDEESMIALLEYIAQLQSEQYNTLKEKMSALLSLGGLDLCLLKYNINGSSLLPNVRTALESDGNFSKYSQILAELSKRNFPIADYMNFGLANVLIIANYEQVLHICRLWDNRTLNIDFIKNNLGLYISKDSYRDIKGLKPLAPLYEILITNSETFRSSGIDLESSIAFNLNMLLTNITDTKRNSELLRWYQRVGVKNGQLLVDGQLFDIVDYLLEQGYNPTIMNAIDLTGINAQETIKRLELSKTVEFNGVNTETVIATMQGKDGVRLTSRIDEYVADEVILYPSEIVDYHLFVDYNDYTSIDERYVNTADIIEALNDSYDRGTTYDIGNISISKYKVWRILSMFKGLGVGDNNLDVEGENIILTALTYNSYLTTDQVDTIKEEIKNNMRIQKALKGKRRS